MAETTTTTVPSKHKGGKPNHHKKKHHKETSKTTQGTVTPNVFYQHEGVIVGSIVCLLFSIGTLVVIGSFRKR